MNNSLSSYVSLCKDVGRQPDQLEYMAWSFLGLEPEWYKELIKE